MPHTILVYQTAVGFQVHLNSRRIGVPLPRGEAEVLAGDLVRALEAIGETVERLPTVSKNPVDTGPVSD